MYIGQPETRTFQLDIINLFIAFPLAIPDGDPILPVSPFPVFLILQIIAPEDLPGGIFHFPEPLLAIIFPEPAKNIPIGIFIHPKPISVPLFKKPLEYISIKKILYPIPTIGPILQAALEIHSFIMTRVNYFEPCVLIIETFSL